jgi:3-hydroxybutyryl-CoA dehydrogenase
MPMINEAIETLYNKVAGVYEIDTVMKLEWDTQWVRCN